mgnify:CR=1 FL=1
MDRKMQKAGRLKREIPFYLMLLPGIIVVFIYQYIPLGGLVMAFQDFDPSLGIFGSPWAGLSNFDYIFSKHYFQYLLHRHLKNYRRSGGSHSGGSHAE